MHSAQCTMQSAECTVHNAQCTMHSAECKMHHAQNTEKANVARLLPLKALGSMFDTTPQVKYKSSIQTKTTKCDPLRIIFQVTKQAYKPGSYACRNYNRVTGVESLLATSVAKNCVVF